MTATLTPFAALPTIGAQVVPNAGVRWSGREMIQAPHTVVAVQDERATTGNPADAVVVLYLTSLVRHMTEAGHPVNLVYGAHLGPDDFTVLDAPVVEFATER